MVASKQPGATGKGLPKRYYKVLRVLGQMSHENFAGIPFLEIVNVLALVHPGHFLFSCLSSLGSSSFCVKQANDH